MPTATIKRAIHPPFCGLKVEVLGEVSSSERKEMMLHAADRVLYWTKSQNGESWHFGDNLEFTKQGNEYEPASTSRRKEAP